MGDWQESGGIPRHIAFNELPFRPRFAYGEQAEVAVVTGSEDGTALGSGFARFLRATIPWTVQYDEVLLVLEGEVTVETAAARGDTEPAKLAIAPPTGSCSAPAMPASLPPAVSPRTAQTSR